VAIPNSKVLEEASASYYAIPAQAVVEPQLPKPEPEPLATAHVGVLPAAEQKKASSDTIEPPKLETELDLFSKEYGVSEEMARKIIFCESSNNPYAVNKHTDVGEDIGYFQINTYYHQKKAKELGFDIFNPVDNLAYGFWLIKHEGTRHWSSSSACHGY
jgi:soluble lytic murein transglycosylase-like protein